MGCRPGAAERESDPREASVPSWFDRSNGLLEGGLFNHADMAVDLAAFAVEDHNARDVVETREGAFAGRRAIRAAFVDIDGPNHAGLQWLNQLGPPLGILLVAVATMSILPSSPYKMTAADQGRVKAAGS